MADPIRNKKFVDLTAPTPQNTPSAAAPISSHAQEPSVASIKEVDDLAADRAVAASLLAQNPRLVSMVEARLSSLIGKSSGYIENLPVVVRRRVAGLKGLQKEHSKLEVQFQQEVLELEKKYLSKFAPIYEKRSKIVNGQTEPSQEEVEAGEPEDDEKDLTETAAEEKTAEGENAEAADTKGVPEFWLSAMKNTISLSGLITPQDEVALKSLTDIRMEYLDKPGFRLVFEFSANDFFTNTTLSKTYYYQEEMGYGGEFIYDYAEGEDIDWKPLKDLTTRIEQKKQRNKTTKQTRVIKKTVPVESFFNFFTPPKPQDDDEDDLDSDIEDRLELDYQLGEDIKEKLIPHAIDWFTGEALQFEELEGGDEDDYDEEEEDDEELSEDPDEEEESEEEDDDPKAKQKEAAECKQS